MQCVAPYITAAVPSPSIPALLKAFMHICNNDIGASDEEEEDGIDLCNCEFSLAYGMLSQFCASVAQGVSSIVGQWVYLWVQSYICFIDLTSTE